MQATEPRGVNGAGRTDDVRVSDRRAPTRWLSASRRWRAEQMPSGATLAKAGPFFYETPFGSSLTVKGAVRPVEAWEITGPRER